MRVPQNGWFIMENPFKMNDLGYPHFRKPLYIYSIYNYIYTLKIIYKLYSCWFAPWILYTAGVSSSTRLAFPGRARLIRGFRGVDQRLGTIN